MKYIFAFLFTTTISVVKSQTTVLNIGDRMPEYRYSNLVNSKKTVLDSKDLEGKLILLDFWGSKCGSCIKSMPKMNELQEKFKNELQIIFVAGEDEKVIKAVLEKRKSFLEGFNLPIMANDATLRKMFPHAGIPHVVWIGKDGLIKAITTGNQVTEKSIKMLLEKDEIDLPVKRYFGRGGHTPFKVMRLIEPGEAYSYSFLTQPIEGLAAEFGYHCKGDIFGVLGTNVGVYTLYTRAYRHKLKLDLVPLMYRSSVLVRDPDRLVGHDSIRNVRKAFCYGLYITTNSAATRDIEGSDYMISDLDRLFKVKSQLIKKEVECVVVKKCNDVVDSKQGDYILEERGQFVVKNHRAQNLVQFVPLVLKLPTPVFYEGETDGVVEFTISKGADINEFCTVLEKSGCTIVKEKRMVDWLEIRDM